MTLGLFALALGPIAGGLGGGSSTIEEPPVAVEEASSPAEEVLHVLGSLALTELDPPRVDAGEVQPDYLKFGAVRVGSTVEGSVRIFREGEGLSGLAVRVVPPAFVRVEDIALGSQTYGSDTRGYCDIEVSIDTGSEGDHAGELIVELGDERVEVPVSVTVLPKSPGLRAVLVAETPFEKFSTEDATIFSGWLRLVREGEFDVSYLNVGRGGPVLREIDLDNFDVVFLGETGLVSLQGSDIDRLRQFVEGGGRLIVAANAFYQGTVEGANTLLFPYGLKMVDTEPGGLSEFDIGPEQIADHPLTSDVEALYFHRPSPVAVTDREGGEVLVPAPVYPGEGFVAVARAGDGEVIALGQSLWWSWVNRADNASLLRNLLLEPVAEQ